MTKLLNIVALVIACSPVLQAQDKLDTVHIEQTVREAVKYMDRNLPTEAIRKWDEAIQLRPGFTQYKYERAICFMMLKDYSQAIEALKPIYRDPNLFDRGYQLLGNCYDFTDDTAKARTYYREGLVAWPQSGRLHYEMGNAAFLDKDAKGALDWWVKGTRVEPAFATNYYQICTSFANTPFRFWALFYGELFLNIERATHRTSEVSALLFATWNASLKPGTDDPIVMASEEMLNAPSKLGSNVMNFATAYEYTLATSLVAAQVKGPLPKLTIEQLVDVRLTAVRAWKEAGYVSKYPNDLLSYQVTMLDAGWLTEYLWWLYSYGDTKEMNTYYRENEQRYDTFLGWFGEHPLDITHPVCLGYLCP